VTIILGGRIGGVRVTEKIVSSDINAGAGRLTANGLIHIEIGSHISTGVALLELLRATTLLAVSIIPGGRIRYGKRRAENIVNREVKGGAGNPSTNWLGSIKVGSHISTGVALLELLGASVLPISESIIAAGTRVAAGGVGITLGGGVIIEASSAANRFVCIKVGSHVSPRAALLFSVAAILAVSIITGFTASRGLRYGKRRAENIVNSEVKGGAGNPSANRLIQIEVGSRVSSNTALLELLGASIVRRGPRDGRWLGIVCGWKIIGVNTTTNGIGGIETRSRVSSNAALLVLLGASIILGSRIGGETWAEDNINREVDAGARILSTNWLGSIEIRGFVSTGNIAPLFCVTIIISAICRVAGGGVGITLGGWILRANTATNKFVYIKAWGALSALEMQIRCLGRLGREGPAVRCRQEEEQKEQRLVVHDGARLREEVVLSKERREICCYGVR
jgi:hypothetical protein